MECQNEEGYCSINLGTSLKIASIHDQQKILSSALSYNKPIRINGSEIIQIDTASLQLLLSFILFINEKRLAWEWQTISPSLISIANIIGMHELLQLPP